VPPRTAFLNCGRVSPHLRVRDEMKAACCALDLLDTTSTAIRYRNKSRSILLVRNKTLKAAGVVHVDNTAGNVLAEVLQHRQLGLTTRAHSWS
jgi:hypothetical protein